MGYMGQAAVAVDKCHDAFQAGFPAERIRFDC